MRILTNVNCAHIWENNCGGGFYNSATQICARQTARVELITKPGQPCTVSPHYYYLNNKLYSYGLLFIFYRAIAAVLLSFLRTTPTTSAKLELPLQSVDLVTQGKEQYSLVFPLIKAGSYKEFLPTLSESLPNYN